MVFDWTVNLGAILHGVAIIFAGIVAFWSLKGDVRILQLEQKHTREQLQILNGSFGQLSEILKSIAVQDTRIAMLEKQIDELKHGEGFVR